MNKLFRLTCLSITLVCFLMVNTEFAAAKKSSKKSSRGKAAAGSSKKGGSKKVASRKNSREVAKRGGKKLSRRELAAMSKKERRGRGRASRRGRSYVARADAYQSRGNEPLKIREEAPLHVGDEDPQPATINATPLIAAPTPAPVPRTSGIPAERVMEIQNALLKTGYYQGEATGVYDDNTKQAMKKYQQAHNLQASGLPSAHALKKLGVAKRKNDDYAVPVKSAKHRDDERSPNDNEGNRPENQ